MRMDPEVVGTPRKEAANVRTMLPNNQIKKEINSEQIAKTMGTSSRFKLHPYCLLRELLPGKPASSNMHGDLKITIKQKHKNHEEGTRVRKDPRTIPRRIDHPEMTSSCMCRNTTIPRENTLERYQSYKNLDTTGPSPSENTPHSQVRGMEATSPFQVTIRLSRTLNFNTNTYKTQHPTTRNPSSKDATRGMQEGL